MKWMHNRPVTPLFFALLKGLNVPVWLKLLLPERRQGHFEFPSEAGLMPVDIGQNIFLALPWESADLNIPVITSTLKLMWMN